MRFLFINADYPDFIADWYRRHPGLAERSYAEQMASRMESLFGVADFYSRNMTDLGHPSADVLVNHEPLQRAWCAEHGAPFVDARRGWRLRRGIVPWYGRRASRRWWFDVLEAQVRQFRPDVLYSMCVEVIGSDFLRRVKGYYGLAVGQHAAPSPCADLAEYDLMLSSLPNHVDRFRRQGLRAEHFKLAFDPIVLARTARAAPNGSRCAVHVGGYSSMHAERNAMLEQLCSQDLVDCYGYDARRLARDSSIRRRHKGVVWALDMFRVRQAYPINVTHHAESFTGDAVNNMAMYEATGVGSCLVVDHKANLGELFEVGREVVAYAGAEDCAEKIRYLLAHEARRREIAEAGRARTLREHTYANRMAELVDIVRRAA